MAGVFRPRGARSTETLASTKMCSSLRHIFSQGEPLYNGQVCCALKMSVVWTGGGTNAVPGAWESGGKMIE